MSTITREFTKEQLQQIIETDHVQCGEASALARIALASPECRARPVHPRITSEELDDDTLDELIDFRRSTFEYHSQQGNKVQTIIHGVTLTAMFELKERRAAMLQGSEPVTTAYKLPDDFDFDRFNDVVWLEAVASNPHMHSLATSTIAMVALELNKRLEAGNSPVIPDCWCRTCRPITLTDMRFVVCPDCGNKRCPHANDHRNACTGSNEPGQEGGAYPAAPQQEA